jgi:hypothetical protein
MKLTERYSLQKATPHYLVIMLLLIIFLLQLVTNLKQTKKVEV